MKDTNQEKVILMKVDYAFKYVMRNKNVMKGFLSAVLGVDKKEIIDIEYLDTNTEKDGEGSKLGIMDLLVSMNRDRRINIEIQLYYMEGWLNRSLFYLCEEYTTGFRSGKGYADDEIPSAISINIVDFTILKNEEWVYNTYKMINPRSMNVLTDKLDIHIIELKKLKQLSEEELEVHGEVIKWAKFIAAETWKEYEAYGREDADMAEAVEELRKINADEIERLRYLHREIAMRDEYQRKVDEEKRRAEQKEYEKNKKEYERNKKEYERNKKEYERNKKEYERNKKEYERDKKEYEKNIKEYEKNIKEYEKNIKEFEKDKREFNKMKKQISEQEKQIEEKEELLVKDRVEKEKDNIMIVLRKLTEGISKEDILKEGYSAEDVERIEKIINMSR